MRTVSNMESGTPGVNNRSVEAVDALGVPIQMRQAAVELIANHDYEKAAWSAGVTADVVRGWAEDPLFIAAIGCLARSTGVFVEPAAAAYAGLVKHCANGAIKPDERALLMLTGNGLKDVEAARRASSEPFRIKPDIAELDKIPSWFGLG